MGTVPSARQRFFFAALAFLFVLSLGYSSDLLTIRHPSWMITDDFFLGIVAAIVVFRYEKERSRILSEKLRVIRQMNAFVRNELQILYASLSGSEKARIQAVERGVERIDWALRELLPGVSPQVFRLSKSFVTLVKPQNDPRDRRRPEQQIPLLAS